MRNFKIILPIFICFAVFAILSSCNKDDNNQGRKENLESGQKEDVSSTHNDMKKPDPNPINKAMLSFPWPCYWNPDPCTTCTISCDDCTFYYYCGPSPECNIYVYCTKQRFISIKDNSGAVLASSLVDPTWSPPYFKAVLPSNFNGTTNIEVRLSSISPLLDSDSKYYNFQ